MMIRIRIMNQRKMSSQAKSRMKASKFTIWEMNGERERRFRTGVRAILMVLIWCMIWRIEIDTFDYNGYKPPKGKSIAHNSIATDKAVYISLDIETGRENCGIIQLSAQIFRMLQHNSKMTSEIESECFDEYVMPSKDSIWDENYFKFMVCIEITLVSKEQMISLKYGDDISRSLTFMLILTYSYIF